LKCIYTNSKLFTNKPNKNNTLPSISQLFLMIMCFSEVDIRADTF